MIYFFLWVAFLLTVLLAVPIASYLEKRKYRAANSSLMTEQAGESGEEWSEEASGEADPMGDGDPLSSADSGASQVEEAVEFGEVDGGDDFAAFDDI